MATVITSECINCGACEPECPNTAIYQGGAEWELNGVTHPAITPDIFYIVPEKCTECVGFYDHEACAAVCPVDCCVPNPQIPEPEDVLLARARQLHPTEEFPADFPSRFKKEAGTARATEAAPAPAPALVPPAGLAAAAPAVAAQPAAPPAAASVAPAAAPAPTAAPAAAAKSAAALGARVERPLAAPKATPTPAPALPRKEKVFQGELSGSFDAALAQIASRRQGVPTRLKVFALLAQPLLGALSFSQKKTIEEAVGDPRVFTAAGATGVNILHNMILYPAILAAVGALTMDRLVFSQQLNSLIVMGVGLASLEAVIRMREGVLWALPLDQVIYRGTVYGPLVAALLLPFSRTMRRAGEQNTVPFDGFHDATFGDKMERKRRYGELFSLQELGNGYLLTVEFPRHVPPSALKDELGIADEMPDYDYDLALRNGFFVVKAHVTDPNVRKLAAVSPAFPPDFMTNVELPSPVSAFKHRFRGKTLEVVLLKQ
jgi:ferredoxin